MSASPSCPEHVLAAIAWYPEGLSPEERGAVEAHAADCRACREELAFLRGDDEPDVAVPDPARVYEGVLARIEAHEETAEADAARAPAGGPARRSAVGRRAFAAGIAAALVAGVLGGAGTVLLTRPEPVYRTASAPPATPAVSARGDAHLDVVFRDAATAEEIARSLRDVGAEVVAGPSPLGVYRVRLAPGTDSGAAAGRLEGREGGAEGVATFAKPAAR